MTDMTDAARIAWIDQASIEELLRKWRFAPAGDGFFYREVGRHFAAVLKERREADPNAYVEASKRVGWK